MRTHELVKKIDDNRLEQDYPDEVKIAESHVKFKEDFIALLSEFEKI